MNCLVYDATNAHNFFINKIFKRAEKLTRGPPRFERHRSKEEMNTLENLLNNAVEEKGWRISPRASLEDRLVRYLTLTWQEQGRELNEEDARGAAQLMILKHSGESTWSSRTRSSSRNRDEARTEAPKSEWTGRTRSSSRNWEDARTEANNNVNVWSGRTEAPRSVWSGRTRSSTRPEFIESSPTSTRTVTTSRDGSVRVTFSNGTHPMIRRSQVNGTHPMVRRSQVSSSR